ncbi:glycosyltransferase family 9 protein [Nocardia sp. NPDC047038]|uniref:glycosyltransferase family 9 protein n=1 Tax=Nocardia sp. NPDC047038 TaxID=3154338 RepID=UPI003401F976
MTARVVVFADLRGPGLGDLVQRNIMLALLRSAYPASEITLVVGESVYRRNTEFLTEHTYADTVVCCPDGDRAAREWQAFTRWLARGAFRVCVVDPDSVGLDATTARDAAIPVRLAVLSGGEGDAATTHPIRPGRTVGGVSDLYDYACALARAIGLPASPRPGETVPPLPLRSEQVVDVAVGRPLVVVHPGGAPHWNRRWPLDRYAEVCVRLADAGATTYLLGDAAEQTESSLLRRLIRAERPAAAVQLAVGLPLNRTLNLLAAADLLIGNDSAPAHLSAALRTPAVVLYGPTDTEWLWTRVYPRHRGVSVPASCRRIRHTAAAVAERRCEYDCSIRYLGPDGPYPRCLTELPVATVWRAVDEILATRLERTQR